MDFCITATELKKALEEIEQAEHNGFMYCLAVFRIVKAGRHITDNLAEYSDLFERAHPTDGNLDWGRFQAVSRYNRFIKGKLVPIIRNREKEADTP